MTCCWRSGSGCRKSLGRLEAREFHASHILGGILTALRAMFRMLLIAFVIAVAESPGMAGSHFSRNINFSARLWLPVLGRAARPVRHRRGSAGDHTGLHHGNGNYLSSHATSDRAFIVGASSRALRRGRVGESFFYFRRSAHQSRRGIRTVARFFHLVHRYDSHASSAASGIETNERRRSNVLRRTPAICSRHSDA